MTASGESDGRGRAARIERATAVPRILLALAYIPTFLVRYWPGAAPDLQATAAFAANTIIALFTLELALRVAVAEERRRYLRAHWVDVLVVLVPFLRLLGFLPLLRLLPFLLEAAAGLRPVLGRYRGTYVLVVGLLAVLTAAAVVLLVERRAGGSIRTFGDALWWAAATITTVGYGDLSPVTAEGRVVAVLLMVVGIALFGMLTAGIAAYFVEGAREGEETVTLKEVLARLDALDARLEEYHRASAGRKEDSGE